MLMKWIMVKRPSSDITPMALRAYQSRLQVILKQALLPTMNHLADGFQGISNMYVHRDPRFYATINYNGTFFIRQASAVLANRRRWKRELRQGLQYHRLLTEKILQILV